MRVTSLLVFFLAGAHSFKAVERRAVLMGKGAGGETARSVAEDAIQPAGLDNKVEVAQEINKIRATLGAPACNPHIYYSGSGSFYRDVNGGWVAGAPGGPAPHLCVPASNVCLAAHDASPDMLEGTHGIMPGPLFSWGPTLLDKQQCAWESLMNRRSAHRWATRPRRWRTSTPPTTCWRRSAR